MSALAFRAKALGVADSTGDFRICKMIEGQNKERIRMPDDRSPFSPAILMRFGESWGSICSERYEASLFQAATLLTFLEHFVLVKLWQLVSMTCHKWCYNLQMSQWAKTLTTAYLEI